MRSVRQLKKKAKVKTLYSFSKPYPKENKRSLNNIQNKNILLR